MQLLQRRIVNSRPGVRPSPAQVMHARLAALQERKKQLVGLPLWALLSLDGPSYKQSSSSSLQQALAAQTKSSEADGAKDDVTITGVSTTSHTPCGTVSKFSAPAGKLQKRAAHVPKIEKVTSAFYSDHVSFANFDFRRRACHFRVRSFPTNSARRLRQACDKSTSTK